MYGLGQKNIYLINISPKNSIEARDSCFHLFLNENYKKKHARYN